LIREQPDEWRASDLGALGSLLGVHGELFTHGGHDNDIDVLAIIDHLLNSITKIAIGELDIVLGVAGVIHEGKEIIIGDIEELEFATADVGDIHVVGGGRKIFQLLAGEDVDGDQVDFGVAVLASLGGGHFDDLAGTTLDDDVAVLPQGRALHGKGGRGTGISRLEGMLMLRIIVLRHGDEFERGKR